MKEETPSTPVEEKAPAKEMPPVNAGDILKKEIVLRGLKKALPGLKITTYESDPLEVHPANRRLKADYRITYGLINRKQVQDAGVDIRDLAHLVATILTLWKKFDTKKSPYQVITMDVPMPSQEKPEYYVILYPQAAENTEFVKAMAGDKQVQEAVSRITDKFKAAAEERKAKRAGAKDQGEETEKVITR